MNTFNITGRISRDVALYATSSGNNFAWISVAVKKKFKNKEGKYDADFIEVATWRQKAEFASKYLKKGDMVGVQGHMTVETKYNEHSGHNESQISLVADEIEILASKPKEYTSEDYKKVKEKVEDKKEEVQEADPFEMFGAEVEINDEDLPFN